MSRAPSAPQAWLALTEPALIGLDLGSVVGLQLGDGVAVVPLEGGVEEGVDGRETYDKSLVVIAVELLSKGFGRVRLATVPDARRPSLVGFVCDAVEPGSTVRTDGLPAYGDLADHGYRHVTKAMSRGRAPAHLAMPGVHRVASLLKRWLLGTHQGAVSAKHLDYYLDEFAFRSNRRTSRARGLLFYRLLQQAVEVDPAPYRQLVAAKRGTHHNPLGERERSG